MASTRAVAALGLQVIQECQDGRGIEIVQAECQDRLTQPLGEVGQEQAEGVAIHLDGARAHPLLLDQAAAEKVLDQNVEGRGHGVSPCAAVANRSKRWPASASNS